MRLSKVFLFTFFICTSIFATELSLDKKVNLLICTEKAPVLCPFFNLTEKQAKRKVNMLCSGNTFGDYGIEGVWKKGKIVDIKCFNNVPEVSDQSCQASGFDCASEGICIDHGAVKPDYIGSFDPGFLKAQALVSINPSSIYQFPEFYYTCSNK